MTDTIVLGAGVSGLTTAICLAEAGADVRVLTAAPPRETASVVAGAIWGPCFLEPRAATLAWTERSLRDFRALAGRPGTGVRMAPVLTVGWLPPAGDLPPEVRLVPDLRACAPGELPAGFGAGFRSTMPLVDMPVYLDYLARRLTAAGGRIEHHAVRSLEEAAALAPLVANCTGLAAARLAADPTLTPSLGQHVVLTNPGLDEAFLELSGEAESTSFFPHPDRVVCGSLHIPATGDTAPDPAVTERILARCRRVEPRLRDAEVVKVETALRPVRPSVRVGAEPLGAARCVHNYGHGGAGVSLSWGCAREAAALLLGQAA
ncbi:FAD-dependent oxidoreductase [Actinomadura kijaniata]|uniref:FAD-dependent oxidoreductase n=1 Tax=Actinomadura kijaniata TaxID=46161 RepID=UPI003F1955AF